MYEHTVAVIRRDLSIKEQFIAYIYIFKTFTTKQFFFHISYHNTVHALSFTLETMN